MAAVVVSLVAMGYLTVAHLLQVGDAGQVEEVILTLIFFFL